MIENHQKCWNKCILIFAPKIAKIALIDSIANFCAKIRIVLFRKNLIFGAKFEIIFDLKMAHFLGENSNISTESYVQIVERNSSTSDSEKTQKLFEIHATLLMLFFKGSGSAEFPHDTLDHNYVEQNVFSNTDRFLEDDLFVKNLKTWHVIFFVSVGTLVSSK